MTSEQRRLLPASRDDSGASLRRAQFVAGSFMQHIDVRGTEVRQGVALEPSPQVFDGIEFGRVGRQEGQLQTAPGAVDIVAHQPRAMRPQSVPDDEQSLPKLATQRFEEDNDLLAFDCSREQSETAGAQRQSRNDRELLPVEMKLHDGGLSPGRPGAHSRRPFAQARFVDEYDQSALGAGFFLRRGHSRFFQRTIASSLRSSARRSGFWLEKPSR